MFKKQILKRLNLVLLAMLITGCSSELDSIAEKPELLIYCGITMVRPMTEIAQTIEKQEGISIKINQGGSEDLYQSLKASRQGDLYLPGSESYRNRHLKDELLGDFVHVGYNQAAMVVKKGNPRQVTPDITQLLRDDLNIVICNPESGSIGRETKKILDRGGIYNQVLSSSVYLTTDSRNLNGALKKGDADLIINWRATAFFEKNRASMEVIDLPSEVTKPKKLLLNLLTTSKHPDMARRFMDYATSAEGQSIFRKYGFLSNDNAVN